MPLIALTMLLMAGVAGAAGEPDRLSSWLGVLEAELPSNGFVFLYSSPPSGYADPTLLRLIMASDNADLNAALAIPMQGAMSEDLTGIALGEVDAVLSYGMPPRQGLVLGGPRDFAHPATEVLPAAGFDAATRGDFSILSRGEDYAINIEGRNRNDPFGGNLGRSQRFAIGDHVLAVAYGTSDIEAAVRGLSDPQACTRCELWRTMLDALESAAGTGAHLDGAIGLTPEAFVGRAEPSEAAAAPQFLLATLALTSSHDGTTVQAAIHFAADGEAEAALPYFSQRFDAFVPDAELASAATDAGSGSTATFTFAFADETPIAAYTTYQNWVRALYRREFTPLMAD